jgi:uncharacterized delta-60 repeat protein/gliding motility-associated-like protein
MVKKVFFLLFYSLGYSIAGFTQPGSLDLSFGTNGLVTPAASTLRVIPAEPGSHIALQSDGKILYAGFASAAGSIDIAVARFNIDGTIDNSFGTNGKITTAVGTADDLAHSILIDNNGRILVAGVAQTGAGYDLCLVRYTATGVLDNIFGINGKVITNFGYSNQEAFSIAIQPDGKIVAGGTVGSGYPFWDFAVMRYNEDGTLDNSFGTNGLVVTDLGRADNIMSIALQPDGKIVATGNSSMFPVENVVVARYNTNGTPDVSFGSGGKIVTTFGFARNLSFSIKVQGDNKILIGGSTGSGYDNYALRRYNTDGSPDINFGTNGIQTTDLLNGSDIIYSLSLQSDGKIIAAGYSSSGGISRFSMIRYSTLGIPDPQFGNAGQVTTIFPGNSARGYSSIIQPDEKIIISGAADVPIINCALARYHLKTIPVCSPTVQINTLTPAPYCVANGVSLAGSGSGITGPSVYTWTLPNGSTSTGSSLLAYTSGKYYLRYHTIPDTCGKTDSITLDISKPPRISLGNDLEFCPGDNFLLKPDNTLDITSYNWQDGAATPQLLANQSGTYWLKAANDCGSYTDTVLVIDKPGGCDCKVYIPSAFTPNNDGKNDTFKPVANCHFTGEMKIYNRWGAVIYSTTDMNTGWNGTLIQQQQDTGVFIYYIKYKTANSPVSFTKWGVLTLIR